MFFKVKSTFKGNIFAIWFLCFRYILAIDSKKDVEEYMYDLLDKSEPKSRKFVEELLRKWKPSERQVPVPEDAMVRIILCSFKDIAVMLGSGI